MYIHLIGDGDHLRSRQARADAARARLDFERAEEVFAGPTIDIPDTRRHYGELRINSIGYLSGRMVFICWTQRGDARHIISMRKANAREQARYWKTLAAAYGEGTEEN
jgi:uncharacterized DUF497 family protein